MVELDCLGDPSAFLENWIPELEEDILKEDCAADEQLAEVLASHYIEEVSAQGYPLPSDFLERDEADEDQAIIKVEFLGFIREWRHIAFREAKDSTPAPPSADFHTTSPIILASKFSHQPPAKS